MISVGIMLVTK